MSLTLGEKLRQAREARGININEVAEQTRIAPLYLECIENNDYRTLPGGIFSKGFVKSFAKYVGLDEQEALQDYASLVADQNNQVTDDPKTYRPEVLTDDRYNSSRLPTIIFAVVILGLMTGGILTLVNYLQQNSLQTAVATNSNPANSNTATDNTANINAAPTPSAPLLNETKVEFKALSQAVWLTSNVDDKKSSVLVKAEKPEIFQPKQKLNLAFSKTQIKNVQMMINGKPISLPSNVTDTKRNIVELNISNENIKQIWESGAINFVSAAPANVTPNRTTR